jgi:hypothetical protein
VGELSQILPDVLFRNGSVNEEDWTEDYSATDTVRTVDLNGTTFSLNEHPDTDSVAYRCVTGAHNNLGAVPTAPVRHSGSFSIGK